MGDTGITLFVVPRRIALRSFASDATPSQSTPLIYYNSWVKEPYGVYFTLPFKALAVTLRQPPKDAISPCDCVFRGRLTLLARLYLRGAFGHEGTERLVIEPEVKVGVAVGALP